MYWSIVMPIETPVLIVGGGPIGLALAADLGRRGVEAILIERRAEKLGAARMIEVGVRTMEICRQLGVTDEIWNWGFPHDHPLDNVFVTHLDGYELGRVKAPSFNTHRSSPFSPERPIPCPQTWFDPILKKRARSFPQIQLRYQMELQDFVQDSDGVTVDLVDRVTGRSQQVRAKYLIGCDGSDSLVRSLLGIQIRGQRHLDWSLNVYLKIPNFKYLHRTTSAFRYVFVGAEGTWSFLTMVDGKDLYRLQLIGVDKAALETADIPAYVRRCFGRDVPYTVEEKVLWIRKMTIADRFMDGRVFLAGDAAHAHPPNGGLGMNTGIQDAFDLGWKLEAVLKDWGGPELLDSYDYERRPASSRGNETSLANFRRLSDGSADRLIEEASEEGALVRKTIGDHLVRENTKAWNPPGVHLGYIYNPSPVVIPDGSVQPPDDAFGYKPTAFPGARAPHVWLSPQESIIDLFGAGFTLLQFEDVPVDELRRAAAARNVPLIVHRIRNPQACALYERKLVLVRPDGHVAWRDDVLPEDCLSLMDIVRGAGRRVAARRNEDLLLASTARSDEGAVSDSGNVLKYPARAAG
jgi:2-polyprenyl-6-methoxyphenol hydroxylase-like FAD-dependent oxidoreductase